MADNKPGLIPPPQARHQFGEHSSSNPHGTIQTQGDLQPRQMTPTDFYSPFQVNGSDNVNTQTFWQPN